MIGRGTLFLLVLMGSGIGNAIWMVIRVSMSLA